MVERCDTDISAGLQYLMHAGERSSRVDEVFDDIPHGNSIEAFGRVFGFLNRRGFNPHSVQLAFRHFANLRDRFDSRDIEAPRLAQLQEFSATRANIEELPGSGLLFAQVEKGCVERQVVTRGLGMGSVGRILQIRCLVQGNLIVTTGLVRSQDLAARGASSDLAEIGIKPRTDDLAAADGAAVQCVIDDDVPRNVHVSPFHNERRSIGIGYSSSMNEVQVF